mgnify:CR=1 FL=1
MTRRTLRVVPLEHTEGPFGFLPETLPRAPIARFRPGGLPCNRIQLIASLTSKRRAVSGASLTCIRHGSDIGVAIVGTLPVVLGSSARDWYCSEGPSLVSHRFTHSIPSSLKLEGRQDTPRNDVATQSSLGSAYIRVAERHRCSS